jgi:LmbE family N-acetylglucosaminyl deacetylase
MTPRLSRILSRVRHTLPPHRSPSTAAPSRENQNCSVANDALPGVGPVLVISPHLDDAVLSCGQLIGMCERTTIATVLAGFPAGVHGGWSGRTTGLPIAREANSRRREEDLLASHRLGARSVWFDILAQEYCPSPPPFERLARIHEAVATAIATTGARTVCLPLGVTHPDHVAVSDAVIQVALSSKLTFFVYMDMPYGQARPDHVKRRLRNMRRHVGIDDATLLVGDLQAKQEAIDAYASQVVELHRGFGRYFDRLLTEPEQYWRIHPRAQ